MASLWVGLVVGVPTYYLAGSLVDLGMAWWQGILTVVAANIITFMFDLSHFMFDLEKYSEFLEKYSAPILIFLTSCLIFPTLR
ncbi:putative purine-cytosine permease [Helianthus annuus]|nr:putative purine-cytosine permease [Helianthus annuus]KAJ0888752.1 putative purine-cytosine permease [Helianthus annuus]